MSARSLQEFEVVFTVQTVVKTRANVIDGAELKDDLEELFQGELLIRNTRLKCVLEEAGLTYLATEDRDITTIKVVPSYGESDDT